MTALLLIAMVGVILLGLGAYFTRHEVVLRSPKRNRFAAPDGLPEWLRGLAEHILENLPAEDAVQWPKQFSDAIPAGASETFFARLRYSFLIFWVERQHAQMDALKYPDAVAAVARVAVMLRRTAGGDKPSEAEWDEARKKINETSPSPGIVASASEYGAASAARLAVTVEMKAYTLATIAAVATQSAKENVAWESSWRPNCGYVSPTAVIAKREHRSKKLKPVSQAEARIKRDWLLQALGANS